LVGNGSYAPSAIYRPWAPITYRHRLRSAESAAVDKPPKKAFVNPLRLLTYPDIFLILFYNGIVLAVFYGVTATTSVLFQKSYPFLSETDIGLCYLAIGGGMVIGSLLSGRLLDRDYQIIKNEMIRKVEADGEKGMRLEDVTKEENFPIERARLRTTPIYLAVLVTTMIGYGWCLQKSVNLAVPLILQVISESWSVPLMCNIDACAENILVGYQSIAIMSTTQTLLVDLIPSQGSSITACVCTYHFFRKAITYPVSE
jgi:MFS family permease